MDISDQITKEEIEVFSSLLKQDSIKGHYDKQFANLEFNKNYLTQIKQTSQIPGYPGSGIILAFRKNGIAVTFAVVCTSVVPDFDSEILFFSTLSHQRKMGHGEAAVQLILEEVEGKSVLARCIPKSKSMIRLLERNGFQRVNLGNSKNINFVRLPS